MASACFVSEAILVIVRDEFLLCFFVTAAGKILESCAPIDERRLGFVDLLLSASLESDAGSSMATLSSLIARLMFQDQTYCANEEDICRTRSETIAGKGKLEAINDFSITHR